MSSTVLIVHREAPVRAAARDVLRREGHSVLEADRLQPEGLDRADLLVVSWQELGPLAATLRDLRVSNGFDSLKVVAVAPRKQMREAIRLLEHGADDCVSFPFEVAELAARVNACLRRPASAARPVRLAAGPIVLDRAIHRVLVQDQVVELAPTEFRLMTFFLENPNRVFSRAELLARAWSKNVKAGHRTVDVHVRRLRQQLEPFGCENAIQTVRGFGYRFSVESPQAQARAFDSLSYRFSKS